MTKDDFIVNIYSYSKIYEFNPYIKLFLNVFNERLTDNYNAFSYIVFGVGETKNIAEKIAKVEQANKDFIDQVNLLIKELRTKALSLAFRNEVYQYHFASQKNERSLWRYIERLLKQYPKLLVSRIDLSYLIKIENNRREMVFYMKNQDEIFSAYQQAKKDRQRLFNNIRTNHLFDSVVGYCWRLECAAQQGFYYQCLFFLDGTTVTEDEVFARHLGEYWNYVITKGKGQYHLMCQHFTGHKIKQL